ncbi:tryptophan 2,3-dioxygenase [candidate division KSB1 bacterium]|nr:tryptophan 2,3-dioxygenase [candidate division KSB1 bacterium]NIR70200.1 tryptophan 2,3-dioxygenase [candidate division KSB1 bacterium]NIS27587.1 tryptophan 2,3-dioxygenase [candidate division KSB1 bacterium]NIT74439.1 tryptophan 2,3-dioxygenase [candidate division KSB1 bacterium]NIU28304.1 tryptophan 2,3-dioxygenase [candidate division KSB1 bacterium]
MNEDTPLYYTDYLKLDDLLSLQSPKSLERMGELAHEEMLFIIVHQAYELWFKQILHELDSVIAIFKQDYIDEKNVGVSVSRLNRIIEIQKLLIEQIRVLETMTPLDFLDFRDFLIPASGFQSYQFRLMENRLGLDPEQRKPFEKAPYHARLSKEHQQLLIKSEQSLSLFDLVEKWLERTPFLQFHGFDFWQTYRNTVQKMFERDRKSIENNPTLSEDEKETELTELAATEKSFSAIIDEDEHNRLREKGFRRLSFKATQAALLINLYRDEPILHLPFKLLTCLIEIDEFLTAWRYRHALMVQRMIGSKIGTGGSSGHQYLKMTAEKHKIFSDLTNLSTFFIPRSKLPELPEDLKKNLGFYYSKKES